MLSQSKNLRTDAYKEEIDFQNPQDIEKAKDLHSYLYSFSLEKCEKFFSNYSLSIIFLEYMSAFPQRMDNNLTISKSKDVYYNAMKLILLQMNKALSTNTS
jgi:hypothetical protein